MGPIWAHMGPYGAYMGPLKAHMGSYGPIWARMGPARALEEQEKFQERHIKTIKKRCMFMKTYDF